jgi:hypothetical protein
MKHMCLGVANPLFDQLVPSFIEFLNIYSVFIFGDFLDDFCQIIAQSRPFEISFEQ